MLSKVETSPDPRLPAVDRALSVFELLANSSEGLTLSELSRKLKAPKSTTHYLLHTLLTRRYIQRRSDGRHYLLGLRFADVASASRAELSLGRLIMPHLRRIAARFNLPATAAVQRGMEAVVIANVAGSQDGCGMWIGRHIDLYCTAIGKTLISALSDEEVDRLFRGHGLGPFTPRTITSLAALKTHLALVRTNGYAVNDEEQVAGLRAVAVPLVDPMGTILVSVAIRGTTDQIPNFRVSTLGREMIDLARGFSLTIRHQISA